MYDVLPTAAAYIVAWVVVAGALVRVVQGAVPLIKGIRAAVTLVNEQLQPNCGESLVDKVEQARESAIAARNSAEQTRSALAEHIRSDHGGGR